MAQSHKGNYAPELEHANSIAMSFEGFRQSHLSEFTDIARITCQPMSPPCLEPSLTCQADIHSLPTDANSPHYQFFFVYKHLVHNSIDQIPPDSNKLRISSACFESLAKHLMLPPAFIFSLTRHYLPNGRGSRRLQLAESTAFDSWYFLPVRVQVKTGGSSSAGDDQNSTQMNPFHKLQLPDLQLEIHRSCVGIFSRVDPSSKRFTFVALDFMDGRWPGVALEPKERITEVFKRRAQAESQFGGDYCVHLVYLSSTARWWTNSLNSVNEQLIAYEQKLQIELDSEDTTPEPVLTGLSRALHSIAAHLQRYLSELKSLQAIVIELSTDYSTVHEREISAGAVEDFEQVARGYNQVLSQVEAAHEFAVELEKKTQNILALLFNRIQINSDRLLVANGQAMQAILKAMQQDASLGRKMAKESHTLAQEMKKDSIAMKTIAIVTMFFLPGATFAALLSMPFFDDEEWMGHASRFWIWAVLSVPTTAACFVFYRVWRRRALKPEYKEEDGIPLESSTTSSSQGGHVI